MTAYPKLQSLSPGTGSRPIWTLHTRGVLALLAATAVLALISANGCHIFLAAMGHGQEISLIPSLAYGAVKWLWWGLIAWAMWWTAQRRPQLLSFSFRTILLQLGLGSLVSIAHLELLDLAWRAGLHWPVWRLAYPSINYFVLSSFGADLLIYGFVFGISGFLHVQSQRQLEAIHKLELEKQLSQSQLKALQMQMEPHFLFNTLNAITSLVAQKRNPEAMETLDDLNTILRTTLSRRAPEKVPFTEELRVVESYLAIQKVRFADRLQVKIEASPEALDGLVPCFLLQPIVENAIQHGISPMEAGGLIETCVKRVGDRLWMQVRDNGSGLSDPSTKGHGIGMQNVRERLAYFYPDAYEFVAAPRDSGGYEVTIQIPYERAMA
jgi:signal transduction histidine kinase